MFADSTAAGTEILYLILYIFFVFLNARLVAYFIRGINTVTAVVSVFLQAEICGAPELKYRAVNRRRGRRGRRRRGRRRGARYLVVRFFEREQILIIK